MPQQNQQRYTDGNYQVRQSRFDSFQNQKPNLQPGKWLSQSRAGTPEGLRKMPWQQVTQNPRNTFVKNGNYQYKYERVPNNQVSDTDDISDFYHQLGTHNVWKKVFIMRSGPCAIIPIGSKDDFDKTVATNHANAIFVNSMEEAFENCEQDFSTGDFYAFDEQIDQKN